MDNSTDKFEAQSKERLAYVSGTVLALALLSMKVWPLAISCQTGTHIRMFSLWTPIAGGRGGLFIFYSLVIVISIAAVTILFSAVHILGWGLWLALPGDLGERTEKMRDHVRTISENSYSALGLIFVVVVILVPLTAFHWGIETLLISGAHLPRFFAALVAYIVIGIPLFRVSVQIARDVSDSNETRTWVQGQAKLLGFLSLALVVVVLPAKEFAYTIEVRTAQQTFFQSEPKIVKIETRLGGSASDPSLARLTLSDSAGIVLKTLEKLDLGDGKYVSFMTTKGLSPGRYQIVLEYPQSSLTEDYPFLRLTTTKTAWLVISPQEK
jgi:hypothetical protein